MGVTPDFPRGSWPRAKTRHALAGVFETPKVEVSKNVCRLIVSGQPNAPKGYWRWIINGHFAVQSPCPLFAMRGYCLEAGLQVPRMKSCNFFQGNEAILLVSIALKMRSWATCRDLILFEQMASRETDPERRESGKAS